jgi:hypothetical protein
VTSHAVAEIQAVDGSAMMSAAAVVRSTIFLAELSLNVTEAVPSLGYSALCRVADFIPGSEPIVGFLGLPVRANAAACSAGRRLLRALSGEAIWASR